MDIGDLIKKGLKKKKWTQQELADKIGVHYMTVQKWIAGDFNPTLSNLRKLDKELSLKLKLKDIEKYIGKNN